MKVNVRYFAALREAIGVASEVLETNAANVGQLRAELVAKGGAYAQCMAPGRAVRVAVNQVMASDGTALSADAEVGFFPPVTGG
ncbi:MAG: MoaD/ThiS family protein [Limnohabitans sp.]